MSLVEVVSICSVPLTPFACPLAGTAFVTVAKSRRPVMMMAKVAARTRNMMINVHQYSTVQYEQIIEDDYQ